MLLCNWTKLSLRRSFRILSEIHQGPPSLQPGDPAGEDWFPKVYEELRQLAARQMARQPPGHTLQATALVHEAWIRMGAKESDRFSGRAHFFATAAEAMRHILIDTARRKRALRNGGEQVRSNIETVEIAGVSDDDELLAVHEVLDRLEAEEPLRARVAKLRYFGGLTFEEVAEALGISVATAKRHWAFARAWLYAEIKAQKSQR